MAVSYNEMMTGKKKKQPTMAQAQGQDPLVTAIAEGSTGGSFGANNQAANMPPGVGGNVNASVNNMAANQPPGVGGNMAPPTPPPPPIQQNMPGTVQGTPVQQNMPNTVQGVPVQENMANTVQGIPAQQNMPGSVQGTPVQQNLPGSVQGVPVQQNLPGTVQGTPQGQQNMPGTVQGVPQVQQNLPGSVQGTPQVQQNMPGTVQGEPQVQQNLPGTVQGMPQVQQNMPGTVQGDDLATTLAEDINRQYTEGMLPATTQREDINRQYEEAFGGTTTQADDINRQYEEAFSDAPLQTTPTDIAGAGADMAAAQNVVEPEAAPMADTLEEALRQQYMSRVGGTDDPILASQLADQQMRQNEARKALVEQLGRYGVLRGGGDTAAALARMGEGDERNRLALEAQAAQRRQQDLRDAQGFDLGQRGMGLQEDRAQQDILTQALNRDIARAGQTGIFERDETMAAKRQSAELDALRRGQERADAALTGEFGEDGQQTLQAQRQQAELFGELDDQKTLAGQQLESQLFGEVDDRQTLTGETTRSGLETENLQRRIAEAGQTGLFDTGAANMAPVRTQQAKALQSELDTAALGRDATRAGLTGTFDDDPTLEARLREAGLTGELDGRATIAGRAADLDRVGAALAAIDPSLKGVGDPIFEALTGEIESDERRRAFDQMMSEVDEATSYDDFFVLADKYGGDPRFASALEEVMRIKLSEQQEDKKKDARQKSDINQLNNEDFDESARS